MSHKIELEAKNPEKLTQVEKDTKWFLAHNLSYMVEITLKYQIKLPGLLSMIMPLSLPLNVQRLSEVYFMLGLKCIKLEKKLTGDYGCIVPMDSLLSWNWQTEHYELVEDISQETIDHHVRSFEEAWKNVD